MTVDIVITTFNRAGVVCDAIDSALLTSANKIIVVDDASTDKTFEMLNDEYQSLSRVEIFKLRKNRGVSAAKNYGFLVSKADWVIFLDSDDKLITEACKEAFQILRREMARPIIFFRCIDTQGRQVGAQIDNPIEADIRYYLANSSEGEALTAINKMLCPKRPYIGRLRGYEGIGCARLINTHGPALISNLKFRVYDTSRPDRLSHLQFFSERAKSIALGHRQLLLEFRHLVPTMFSIKLNVKAQVYFCFYSLYKLFK